MSDSDKPSKTQLASQGELVGSLTHDLKGFLTGIEGGLYMVDSGRKKGKPERVDQGFEMLRRNLSRMKRTVSSALYYVKDRELNFLPVEIQGVTRSVIQALSEQAEHSGVGLTAKAEAGTFDGDEFAVHSLLVDLLEYLLDSCRLAQISPSPAVTLSAALTEEHVLFELVADGFLITEDARERALGEHYSPVGGDRSHLSLFIAHKLIKSHCGNLEICCLPEKEATRFNVKLPSHQTGNREQAQ